jgi:hypothetical protein
MVVDGVNVRVDRVVLVIAPETRVEQLLGRPRD